MLKRKPLQNLGTPGEDESEEEIKGITELAHNKMPKAEELQKKRKKEIQQLLSQRGGRWYFNTYDPAGNICVKGWWIQT